MRDEGYGTVARALLFRAYIDFGGEAHLVMSL